MSGVQQHSAQPLQDPGVPVQPVRLGPGGPEQALAESERGQRPVGQAGHVHGRVAGGQHPVHHQRAVQGERRVQPPAPPHLHARHPREGRAAAVPRRDHALPGPHLAGEHRPQSREAAPPGTRGGGGGGGGGAGGGGASGARERHFSAVEVRHVDEVRGGEGDAGAGRRPDDGEGPGGGGPAVQEGQHGAEDQLAAAVGGGGGQHAVAGQNLTQRLGGPALQEDPGVTRETAAGFGRHGVFWRDEETMRSLLSLKSAGFDMTQYRTRDRQTDATMAESRGRDRTASLTCNPY